LSISRRLGQGYRAMAREVGTSTAITVVLCAALFVFAICFGCACLIGVRQTDAMFESSQAQRAFEAVKREAGPRMLVRTLVVTPGELTVWAMDPDMSPSRFVSGTRQHSSHWYFTPGAYEQSWRVTHWTVFRHDWYCVSGPEPEAHIQQDRGSAFDLKPEDIPDLPTLTRTAMQSVAGRVPAQVLNIELDSQKTTVSVNSSKGFSIFSLTRDK
jgi:hypothetical protein